jgi:CubicO group peptidase (beta-lactamase class C family)
MPNPLKRAAMVSSLDRRHFIVMGTAGAVLTALRPQEGWPLQGVAPTGKTPLGPNWTPSPELLRSLPRMLELAGVPGIALGIVTKGQVWKGGFGRATLEPLTLVSYQTVFEAVSLGKPLFAYAVLRLVDAGKIDLERPLYDYLPSPEADNPRMRKVTGAHVLSHTSGLPNWRERPGPLLPATEPGTTFSYSGEAYFYLQRVVERVTDAPFARYMRDELLRPLGMSQSSYIWLPEFESHKAIGRDQHGNEVDVYRAIGLDAEHLAQQWGKPVLEWRYEDAIKALPLINPNWPVLPLYIIPSAGGSLLTTVGDYTRFLSRVVAPPSEPGLRLSPETQRAMVTPRIQLNRVLFWGLGWGIQRDEYGEVLWHWGANNSFRNFVIADRARSRAVVVFTNGEAGPKVYERVIAGVTGHDQAAFLWL